MTVPARPLDPVGGETPNVLFIGNFVHAPNVEGARVLTTEILPAVRETLPHLRAFIVGPLPPAALLEASARVRRSPGSCPTSSRISTLRASWSPPCGAAAGSA
jgi:hypothetical protein